MNANNSATMSNNMRELSNGMNWDTHKKMVECKCKKMWVDGCEDFTPLDMKLSNGVNACPVVSFAILLGSGLVVTRGTTK